MEIEHLTEETFKEKVLGGKYCLVDFFATWCMPCKMMGSIIEQMSDEIKDEISVYKIDVDKNENVAKRYGIMSIPTLIIFKDGQEVARNVGLINHEAILELIENNK